MTCRRLPQRCTRHSWEPRYTKVLATGGAMSHAWIFRLPTLHVQMRIQPGSGSQERSRDAMLRSVSTSATRVSPCLDNHTCTHKGRQIQSTCRDAMYGSRTIHIRRHHDSQRQSRDYGLGRRKMGPGGQRIRSLACRVVPCTHIPNHTPHATRHTPHATRRTLRPQPRRMACGVR